MRRLLIAFAIAALFPITSQATTFAQLALGGGYETVLLITNKTIFYWRGTIWVSRAYNQKWEGTWAVNGQDHTGKESVKIDVAPRGLLKLRFTGDGTTRAGYLEIDADSTYSELNVAVSYFYEFRKAGELQDTIGSPESALGKKFVFAVEKTDAIDTGFAWCPSSRYNSTPFRIDLLLYDQNGSIPRLKTVTFTGHQAQFVTEVFTDLPSTFVGYLVIESQNDLYLEVLRIEKTPTGFQLTSTPADNYVP